jgi:Kelch motif protein
MSTSFQTHRCVLPTFMARALILLFTTSHVVLAQDRQLPASSMQRLGLAAQQQTAPSTRAVVRPAFATERTTAPSSGNPWMAATACPASVFRYAFAQNGEDFYVISGVSGGPNTTNVWRYNATTNIWTKRANIPAASQGPAGAYFNGKIYVAAGDGGGTAFYIYNVATDTWTTGPSRPVGTSSFGAAAGAFNGKIYIVGGGSSPTTTVSIYNIASNTWSAGPTAPTPVQFAGYTQAGPFLYVIGGFTATTTNSTASMRLDMSTDTWTSGPTFTQQRADFGLAAAGTQLFAIGGDTTGADFFDPSDQVDELDTTTWPSGTWGPSPDNLPTVRQGNSAGFVSNGRFEGEIWSTGGGTVGFINEHIFRAALPCLTYFYTTSSGSIVPGITDTGNHADDGSTVVVLPFPYRLYDQEFTSVKVGSNGHLTFGTPNDTFDPTCLPVAGATYAIGPYWTDQCTGACTNVSGAGLGIFTSISGAAPNRIFNIEWRTAYFNSGGAGVPLNYEVRLYERQASFDVIYGTVNEFTPPIARKLSTGVQKNELANQFTLQGCDVTGGEGPPVSNGELFHYTLIKTSCNPPPTPTGLLYVLREGSGSNNQIFGYSVNETTGLLTLLSGFPLNIGGTESGFGFPETLRADRTNQRLYAINNGSDTVSAFAINTVTGALTPMPFSPISLGAGSWTTVTIHPTGSPLLVGQFGSSDNNVKSFNITSSSVVEAAGSPFTGTGARSGVFSRDGSYYYEGGATLGPDFRGFAVNPSNGVLTALAGSPFNAGVTDPIGYATDSQGRLFMASHNGEALLAFTTASGIPSAVTGNSFSSDLSDQQSSGVLHPSEQFYIVIGNDSPSAIGSYRVGGSGAGTTLTAVPGSPSSIPGSGSHALAMNQTGAFLFSCDFNSGDVATYPVNPSTGVVGNQILPSVGTGNRAASLAYSNASMVRTAVSRKTHGAAGVFDINLPLTGTPGVECRNGSGAGLNDHQIVVSCVGPVVSLTDVLIVSGTFSGGSVGASGNVITLNLNGVPNAQRFILEFRGVSDGVNTGNFTVPVNFLVGDTVSTGSVNGTDVSQTKLNSGLPVTGSNFRNDVTVSGSINGTDVSSVKLRSGTGLP